MYLSANEDASYTGTNVVADVAYDAFLSSTDSTTATHAYEIMIWLGALGGAEPIGYWSGAIASSISIGGVEWNLYKGTNNWLVYSFVASSEQTSFSGDIKAFFTYLINNEGVPSSYYLQAIGAGTEPFTGLVPGLLSATTRSASTPRSVFQKEIGQPLPCSTPLCSESC